MLKCIDYLPDDQVVRATVTGEINAADYVDLLVELRGEAARLGAVRQLVELRNAMSQFGQLELHDLPEINKKLRGDELLHTAVVHAQLSMKDLDDLNYFCHRANAEGFHVRLFPDSDSALAWLRDWPPVA